MRLLPDTVDVTGCHVPAFDDCRQMAEVPQALHCVAAELAHTGVVHVTDGAAGLFAGVQIFAMRGAPTGVWLTVLVMDGRHWRSVTGQSRLVCRINGQGG